MYHGTMQLVCILSNVLSILSWHLLVQGWQIDNLTALDRSILTPIQTPSILMSPEPTIIGLSTSSSLSTSVPVHSARWQSRQMGFISRIVICDLQTSVLIRRVIYQVRPRVGRAAGSIRSACFSRLEIRRRRDGQVGSGRGVAFRRQRSCTW